LKRQQGSRILASANDRVKKIARGHFLLWESVFLAAGQVYQKSDVYRKVDLFTEGKDLLRPAVFQHGDVSLGDVADDAVAGIKSAEQNVHQLGSQFHRIFVGFNRLLLLLRGSSRRARRRFGSGPLARSDSGRSRNQSREQ